jgi:hypothetical protein
VSTRSREGGGLALIDEGVMEDQRVVDLPIVSTRPNGASSHR